MPDDIILSHFTRPSLPLTPLVGRHDEVKSLVELLDGGEFRFITLTGPGGVGKTRLALHVADALVESFSHAVWFIGLASITEPDLVLPTVARALGVREVDDQPILDRLVAALGDRRALLVLDNFEHVVTAAPSIAALLSACPALSVLVTSRVRLRLGGEREFAVPPLPVTSADTLPLGTDTHPAEAVQLFVQRACAVQEGFALTRENTLAVVEICRRLDGLPLAIELAAARIKSLPPAALAARLGPRLPLLTGGNRDLPPRQQTMRLAIAWSYDLLPSGEQNLFRRLSVFHGGFTLEAAEAVAGQMGFEVLDGIGSLIDSSLLRQVPGLAAEPRYGMLETVREFGLEQLAVSQETSAFRQRHAAWFLAFSEREPGWTWGGSRQRLWLDQLEADLPNLRAALAWFAEADDADAVARLAVGLWGYWHLRSRRAEGRTWLEQALARNIRSDRTRAWALVVLGELYHQTGTRLEFDLLEQALALSRQVGDSQLTACAQFVLGTASRDRGNPERAVTYFTEAAELAAASGDQYLAATAQLQHGVLVLYQLGPEHAQPIVAKSLIEHQRLNDTFGVACSLLVLGWIAAMRQDPATAVEHYAASLNHWEELGTQEGVLDILASIAELAQFTDDKDVQDEAVQLLGLVSAVAAQLSYVFPPTEYARNECTIAAFRARSSEASFAAAWAAGAVIPAEQAAAAGRAALANLSAALARDAAVPATAADGLTAREREVLRLVVTGSSNPEIADALFLSRRTVTTHLTRIFAKLGVTNRSEAAVQAVRRGLV